VISEFTTTIFTRDWRVIYPFMHVKYPSKTRSVILIHVNILTNNWSQLDINLGDVTIVKLRGDWDALMLFNVYNDCEHDDTVGLIRDFQKSLDDNSPACPSEDAHTIWLGDFNRHHPY